MICSAIDTPCTILRLYMYSLFSQSNSLICVAKEEMDLTNGVFTKYNDNCLEVVGMLSYELL
jgi:hypothetical protein